MHRTLPLLVIIILATKAHGFYPPHCGASHAETDFTDADAVVIARVIKLERKILDDGKGKEGAAKFKWVAYVATLKTGKVIRGDLKKDDEFVMYLGGYRQKEEDNTEVTWIGQFMTHPAAGLQIDGVYILFVDRKRDHDSGDVYWIPRSCHFSVHKLSKVVDEKTGKQSVAVLESLGMHGNTKAPVPVDEFLEAKKKEADESKKAAPKKTAEEQK